MGDGLKAKIRAIIAAIGSDESGQATTEYILIFSASVLGAGAIARAIIGAIDNGILVLGSTLEKDLSTGKAPINVWQN